MTSGPISRWLRPAAAGPATAGVPLHRAPTHCPVCATDLVTLRLGCRTCGTEVSGLFSSCAYCRLPAEDLEILAVFLRSRGNMRDVQAHLGVSYPTARQRFGVLLSRLGLAEEDGGPGAGAPAVDEAQVLDDLAAGRISVADAAQLLGGAR